MLTETSFLFELQGDYEKFARQNQYPTQPQLLHDSINHIMTMKSKKMRPLLVLVSNLAFGGKLEDAMPAAHAVEYFHNFTLVHDDIMDNSEIRRGNPCVHVKYGLAQAILSGDAMMPFAYHLLTLCPPEHFKALFDVFNKSAWEVMDGQQMDIDFETKDDVQLEEYLRMIALKTSVLLGCACKLGAITAGATEEDQQHAYEFGLNLGLAFQIKDDWLDTFGEGEKVGKRIGGDILNNKKTFLMISALQRADKDQLAELNVLVDEKNEEKKIKDTIALFDALDVNQITSDKMEALFRLAMSNLDEIKAESFNKELLKELAHVIYYRDF